METIDELDELHIQVLHVEAGRDEQVVELPILLAEVAANVRSIDPDIVLLICRIIGHLVAKGRIGSADGLIEPVVGEGFEALRFVVE